MTESSLEDQILARARLSELQAERDAILKAKAIREANGLEFYRPHWKQHKFHTAGAFTGRGLFTGNRFGKSDCGVAETLSFALGGRLWYRHRFEILGGDRSVVEIHPGGHNHPFVTLGIPQRPLKCLILVVDWDMAKEVFTGREGSFDTWGKIWKLIPEKNIGKITTGGRGDRITKIEVIRPEEFGGGVSTITFDTVESFKHNRMGGESKDWDYIHIDEPVPESMFKAHSRGLMDRNGKFAFTCTPLTEMWIYDKFNPPNATGIINSEEGRFFDNKYVITGSIYDNPYRNEAGVKEFEASLTTEEKACRLHGLPLNLAGLVYREFVHDMHVLCDVPKGWSEYWLPPLNYTIRVAWDVHGARIPQACLFAATAPDGTVFIYDELFCEPLIKPNAKLVKEKLQIVTKLKTEDGTKLVTLDRHCVSKIIDPKALIVNPVTETADVLEAIEEEGIYFDPASKDLTTGISAVKDKLNERHVVTKLPTIFFSPRLKETLREFSRYVYDPDKNKPKDKDDHMMENLYRLVLNGLDYVEPETNYVSRKSLVRPDEDLVQMFRPGNLLRI